MKQIGIWKTAANRDSYYRNVVLEFNKAYGVMPTNNIGEFHKWLTATYRITEWRDQRFFFDDERDLTMFLLKWGAHNEER